MNSQVFILTARLQIEDGSYDYMVILGVYANIVDAKNEMRKRFEYQKVTWPDYKEAEITDKRSCVLSGTGLRKWYEVCTKDVIPSSK